MPEHSGSFNGLLAGYWHLVAATCPEGQIPQHRVDLVFHDGPSGLRGAIRSRNDGHEIPLAAVDFNGVGLRVKMSAPPSAPAADLPCLVMAVVADHFEGEWDTPGAEHARLKLIRANESSGSIQGA
jgi:hypothetical protein